MFFNGCRYFNASALWSELGWLRSLERTVPPSEVAYNDLGGKTFAIENGPKLPFLTQTLQKS